MAENQMTPASHVIAEVMTNFHPIGSHTAHIAEATDILFSSPTKEPVDGQSGDTNYPYGHIKVLNTVGEYLPSTGCALRHPVPLRHSTPSMLTRTPLHCSPPAHAGTPSPLAASAQLHGLSLCRSPTRRRHAGWGA